MNLMNSILSRRDKGVNHVKKARAGGVLAGLLRSVLFTMNIDQERYNTLIERYLAKTKGTPSQTNKGTLNKEFASDEVTFKVLVKFLTAMGLLKVKITIDAIGPKGEEITTSVDFNLVPEEELENRLAQIEAQRLESKRMAAFLSEDDAELDNYLKDLNVKEENK